MSKKGKPSLLSEVIAFCFLCGFGGIWTYFALSSIFEGQFRLTHGRRERRWYEFISAEQHPYFFWGLTIVTLLIGIALISLGVFEFRAFLRGRRKKKRRGQRRRRPQPGTEADAPGPSARNDGDVFT
jgi:heme exporter protein D